MSARTSLQTAQVRPGDFHLPPDSRQRFGRSQLLSSTAGTATGQGRRQAPYVETPTYDEPQQWTIELRAGAVTGVLSTFLPDLGGGTAYTLEVVIRRALDRDKGVTEDTYRIAPAGVGDVNALPVMCLLAQQLAVYVRLVDTTGTINVVVDVTVARTTSCCLGPAQSPTITRFAQSATSALFLPGNDLRKGLVVQNWGTGPLYLAYGLGAVPPGGSQPRWTMALAGPTGGGVGDLVSDTYQGPVAGVWDADDTLYAMVTEIV